MKFKTVMHSAIAIGIAIWTPACVGPVYVNQGPGCLIQIYTSPNLQGAGLPIVQDTPEVAAVWRDAASSAKVIYGTWRLYTDPDYKGFMGDYKAPADVPQLIPAHKLNSLKCIVREPVPPRY